MAKQSHDEGVRAGLRLACSGNKSTGVVQNSYKVRGKRKRHCWRVAVVWQRYIVDGRPRPVFAAMRSSGASLQPGFRQARSMREERK